MRPADASNLLLHIEKTLALLEHVLEQKESSIIPRITQNKKTPLQQKGEGSIDEDKAVQLVLELEREERGVQEGK